MPILKSFLICTFKDPNLAKNFTNLAENLKKKLTPRSSWSSFFSKSVQAVYQQLCCISLSIFQLVPNTIEAIPNLIVVSLLLYRH